MSDAELAGQCTRTALPPSCIPSMAKPKTNTWIDSGNGLYTWSAGTTIPNTSYNLTVPTGADYFSVATPTSRTKEFSVTATVAQLTSSGGDTSTFTGSATSTDKIKISDGGTITDSMFANFSSVEQLILKNSSGYNATLGALAQLAGIRKVEGGSGADNIDASGYGVGIAIEGGKGNDSLKGGHGNNKIEGGLGADQIDLLTGGTDKVEYDSILDGSGITTDGTFSGFDVITGFGTEDRIDVDFAFNSVQSGSVDPGSLTDFTAVNGVIQGLLGGIGVDNKSVRVLFVLGDGTDAGLYSALVTDTDATLSNTAFSTSEITMLGQFDQTTLSTSQII